MGLVLDVKGQNSKAQPSTSKIVALRNFKKQNNQYWQKNPKKFKTRHLVIKLFIQKRPTKIKQAQRMPFFFKGLLWPYMKSQ